MIRMCGQGHDRHLAVVAAHGDDGFAQACVGCEDAVIAAAVDGGRRDEAASSKSMTTGAAHREPIGSRT
jgi:hypothetical protein